MSTDKSYFIWRCPVCKKQDGHNSVGLPHETVRYACWNREAHGGYVPGPELERVEVVVPEEALTDEMVERASSIISTTIDGYYAPELQDTTRSAMVAAGPWTHKPDREKMIKTVMATLHPTPTGGHREWAERIVDALLEAER